MEETKKTNPLVKFVAVIVLLMVTAVLIWNWRASEAQKEREREAQALFEPAMKALDEGATVKAGPGYDIDKTIRVIHGIDKALEKTESMDEYIQYMARQDYRDVAPDVLEARKKILDIVLRLYAKQSEVDNQEATFTVTRTILSAMSLVQADLSVTGAAPALDKEQAKKVLTDLREDQEEREDLLNELTAIETELIAMMAEYSGVYYKYVAEWDKLSTRRDRAWLAVAEQNWQAAAEAARSASELAPSDNEAHLIEAMALMQLATSDANSEQNYLTDATKALNAYIETHPERTAPALLLLGVANDRMGKAKEARLSFQQAAAYYPKQADILTDMLDPYKVRSFLRKSREGNVIVDQYSSMMLGAGFFSPDLHLARMHFDKDEVDEGRQKILDHFSRRRNQSQWDLILADVEFCHEHLGPTFDQIFVEDSHLRLKVEPTLIGSKLDVSIENASQRALYNATLLLALRFTDMHRDDFEVFKVAETVPTVAANTTTDFGTLEVDHKVMGANKGVDDIVVNRAILVTDDAVMWVDSDEYRLALAREMGQRAAEDPAVASEQAQWFDRVGMSPDDFMKHIKDTDVNVDLSLGKDDISFALPKELAILNPVFRLKVGEDGETAAPSANKLNDDGIQLEFGSAANLEGDDASSVATLILNSTLGNFEVKIDLAKRKIASVRYLGGALK